LRGIEIDETKNLARINLNLFFYPDMHIQKAAKEFESVCKTSISYKTDYAIVELKPKNKKMLPEEAAYFFANFLLEVIQNED